MRYAKYLFPALDRCLVLSRTAFQDEGLRVFFADLRRHRAHSDVSKMQMLFFTVIATPQTWPAKVVVQTKTAETALGGSELLFTFMVSHEN